MRPPKAAIWSVAAVAVAFAAYKLQAQTAPAPPASGGSASQSQDMDPTYVTARARSARTLLRNGLDFLDYGEFERALGLLREAESRQNELSAADRKTLQQGIQKARDGLRALASGEPPSGRTTRSGRSPAGSSRAGAIALAPTPPVTPPPAAAVPVQPVPELPFEPIQLTSAPPADPGAVVRASATTTPSTTPAPAPAPAAAPEPPPLPELVPGVEPPTPSLTDPAAPPPSLAPELAPAPIGVGTDPAPAVPATTTEPEVLPVLPGDAIGSPTAALSAPPAVEPPPVPEAETLPAPVPPPVDDLVPPLPPTSSVPFSAPEPPPTLTVEESDPLAPGPLPEPVPAPSQPAIEVPPVPADAPAPAPLTARPEESMPAPEPGLPPLPEAPPTVIEPPAPPELPTVNDVPAPAPLPAQPAPEAPPAVVEESPLPLPADRTQDSEPPPPAATDLVAPPVGNAALPTLPPSAPPSEPPAAEPTIAPAPAPRPLIDPRRPGLTLPPHVQREVEEIARHYQEEMRRDLGTGMSVSPMMPGPDGMNEATQSESRIELPRPPSPTEPRPIRSIPIPEEFVPLTARSWAPSRKAWAAAGTCHTPLYFQDAPLERYGQSVEQALGPLGRFGSFPIDDPTQSNQRQQILQPFWSIGKFATQIAMWPYNMVVNPPWEAEYDLGYWRPGDKVPPDLLYWPLHGYGPPLRGKKY